MKIGYARVLTKDRDSVFEQGHGGKIINMSSQAGRRGELLLPVHCAIKAAPPSHGQYRHEPWM